MEPPKNVFLVHCNTEVCLSHKPFISNQTPGPSACYKVAIIELSIPIIVPLMIISYILFTFVVWFITLQTGSPQSPSRPFPIKIQSNSITVGWQQPRCSGGGMVTTFNLQYYTSGYYRRSTVRVLRTEAESQNYTVVGLQPSSSYYFQVQAITSDSRRSSYSRSQTIITLPPGTKIFFHNDSDCDACIYLHVFLALLT